MSGELLDITVELWYDSAWQDISVYGYDRDRIHIRRGIANEGGRADPGELTLTVNNRDGRFSPRNPLSPLYGKIGRNTPIRVSAGLDGGTSTVRFVGEVVQWPTRWDLSGRDVYVPITAAGILRRLGTPRRSVRSAPYRWITATSPAPVAYWPLSDPELARLGRPAVGSADWRPLSGSTRFGSEPLADWLGSGAAIVEQSGTMLGDVTMSTSPDALVVDHIRRADAGGSGPSVLDIRGNTEAGGDHWILTFTPPDTVEIQLNVDGSFAFTTNDTFEALFDDRPHHVRFTVADGGGGLAAWSIRVDDAIALEGFSGSALRTGARQVRVSYNPGSTQTPLAFGHVAVWDSEPDSAEAVDAAFGHRGETAGRRIERLCSEEGITFTSRGDLDATIRMGPQRPEQLLALMDEAAAAEAAGGVLPLLVEQRDALGLHFNTRGSFYELTPALELTYSSGHISEPFEPTEDDQQTANHITATRPGDGAEAAAIQETGPLNTASPSDDPQGVGLYDRQVSVNVESAELLPHVAGWALNLGTWDEERYPAIALNLRGLSTRTGGSALVDDAAALDVADLLTVDDLPAWMPAKLVEQIAAGYTEALSIAEWTISWHGVPYGPYRVGVYEGQFEDFEDDELSIETADAGDAAWSRTTFFPKPGPSLWSMRSGSITHNETTDLVVTVPTGATLLRFWWFVDSEEDFDFFEVIADAVTVFAASGATDWALASVDITGASTVTFRYSKDAADTEGVDGVWIDDVQFTGTTPGPAEPARYDTAGCETTASFESGTDTALEVLTTTGPLWTTDSDDLPFDIHAAGVRLRVTAISGATSPQTMTVQQAPVNGVEKTIPAGSAVSLWTPARWAL